MLDAQFEAMEGRLEELSVATAQPEIIADVPRWQGMLNEMAQLEPAVTAWRQYKQLVAQISQAKEMRDDPDLKEMAEEELGEELISNYPTHQGGKLQPYEARVFLRKA